MELLDFVKKVYRSWPLPPLGTGNEREMKKDDIILLVLALGLLLAMVITFLLGGARSRHGYGGVFSPAGQSVVRVSEEQGRPWAAAPRLYRECGLWLAKRNLSGNRGNQPPGNGQLYPGSSPSVIASGTRAR